MTFKEAFEALQNGSMIRNGNFTFQRKRDPKTNELTNAIKADGSIFGSKALLNNFFGDGWEIVN